MALVDIKEEDGAVLWGQLSVRRPADASCCGLNRHSNAPDDVQIVGGTFPPPPRPPPPPWLSPQTKTIKKKKSMYPWRRTPAEYSFATLPLKRSLLFIRSVRFNLLFIRFEIWEVLFCRSARSILHSDLRLVPGYFFFSWIKEYVDAFVSFRNGHGRGVWSSGRDGSPKGQSLKVDKKGRDMSLVFPNILMINAPFCP